MIRFKRTRIVLAVLAVAIFFAFAGMAQAQQTIPQSSPVNCDSSLATASPNPYKNIYMDPGVIFDHPQLVALPVGQGTGVIYTHDNYMLAKDLTPCPNAPWKDPVLTYAAYLYCAYAAKIPPNPLFQIQGQPTASQLRDFQKYDQLAQASMSVYSFCMHQVQRRLAYPDPSNSGYNNAVNISNGATDPVSGCASGNGQLSCIQGVQCHTLKDTMAGAAAAQTTAAQDASLGNSSTGDGVSSLGGNLPAYSATGTAGGMLGTATGTSNWSLGINTTGDTEVDNALMDCDQYGLSEEAADYAEAHACSDLNSVTTDVGNDLTAADGEHRDGPEGCETGREHDRTVEQARMNLASLVMQLNQLRAEWALTQASSSK